MRVRPPVNMPKHQILMMLAFGSAAVFALQWTRTSLGNALGFLLTLYVVGGGMFAVWHLLDVLGARTPKAARCAKGG